MVIVFDNWINIVICRTVFLPSVTDPLIILCCRCTICLADYQEKDVLRTFPYCGHSFHATCIDIWLKQNFTCPICRISLRDSSDRKRAFLLSFHSTADNHELRSIQMDRVGGEQPLSSGENEIGGKHAESPSYS